VKLSPQPVDMPDPDTQAPLSLLPPQLFRNSKPRNKGNAQNKHLPLISIPFSISRNLISGVCPISRHVHWPRRAAPSRSVPTPNVEAQFPKYLASRRPLDALA